MWPRRELSAAYSRMRGCILLNAPVRVDMTPEVIAAFCALGITAITSLVLIMRGIAKIEENLRIHIEMKQKESTGVLMLEVDRSRTMFGESVKAVRQHSEDAHERIDKAIMKHQELEIYIRDNYVEIDSFNVAVSRIEKTVDGMDLKIDKLMSRPSGPERSR